MLPRLTTHLRLLTRQAARRPHLLPAASRRALPHLTRSCRYTTDTTGPPSALHSCNAAAQTYSTPLAKALTEAIRITGPIPLAAYMRQCLIDTSGGYYTTSEDPFGRKGDFITSPEISQMFGEMLGVWVVAEWMSQGKRADGIQLIELGPGRGTLMADVLRTITTFRMPVASIHLVEASPVLRDTQCTLLCGEGKKPEELPNGTFTATSTQGIPIFWHDLLSSVPKKIDSTPATPFVLAHEFFDALPIHAFEATANGWRELMVSPTDPADTTTPEFALIRAGAATPHAMVLPELSERYTALKNMQGAIIEVSPESLTISEDIAKRIGDASGGAALIVDYGPLDTIPVNSLRGIKQHRTVSPFHAPGTVDLSADVDFYALAERALDASEGVEVHGPVEQGAFLLTMGMEERLGRLVAGMMRDAKESGEEGRKKREALETGFKRLVERGGGAMGKIYKVMSIVPERGGRPPVGFGGGLEA